MWKTGHSVIKDKMKKEGAELGGEMSGHIYSLKTGFSDMTTLFTPGLRFLEILSKTGKKGLGTDLQGIPKTFATPEIRIDCPDEIKFQVTEVA